MHIYTVTYESKASEGGETEVDITADSVTVDNFGRLNFIASGQPIATFASWIFWEISPPEEEEEPAA